jgi:hypothetical protein
MKNPRRFPPPWSATLGSVFGGGRDTLVCLMRAVTDLSSPNTKGPSVGSRGQLQRRKMLPPHHVWESTIIAFRSFKADLRPHRKAPKRDGDHGLLALFWQSAHNKIGATAMIPVILAMAFVGMALTTAFGFGLLPL